MSESVAAPAPAESGSEPIVDSNQPAPEPKPAKRYIDLGDERIDEDTLKREREKWRGADGRFREAAKATQEIENFRKALLENPEQILSDERLTIDRKRLAEKWLREAIEAEIMGPREREFRAKEAELNKYKQLEEQTKAEREKSERAHFVNQRKEVLSKTLSEAMAMSPLSKDPEVASIALREMALYFRLCKQNGVEVDAKDLAMHVQNKHTRSYAAVANQLEGEELVAFLGDAIVAKIRKADLARMRKQREVPETVPVDEWKSSVNDNGQRKFIDPRAARIKQ